MTPFARYFKLKNPERKDFGLKTDDKEDLELYVDLDGVLDRLQSALNHEAPQFSIEGSFGSGKSHLLRYVEHFLAPPKFAPVYVLLSGFSRRSDFKMLHQQLMPRLMPLAKRAMREPGGDKAKRVENLTAASESMQRALRALALPELGAPSSDARTAEAWLCAGSKLSAPDMSKAGYALTLIEEVGPAGVIQLYKAVSDLHYAVFQQRILVLLDEGEAFGRVVDVDAQAHIGAGMRGFFDSENHNIGLILGLTTPRARTGLHPMLRSDVQSRVAHKRLSLQPLTSDRVRRFMSQVWPKLTRDHRSPPFLLDAAGANFVEHNIEQLRRLVPTDELSPTPVPRDLLNVLTQLGQAAVDQKLPPPIGVEHIRTWFGL